MKKLLLLLSGVPLLAFPQNTAQPKVVGLITVERPPVAILEHPSFHPATGRQIPLRAGQKEGELEVLGIEPAAGMVRIKLANEPEPQVLKFAGGGLTNGLAFEGIGTGTMLKFLGKFSERTVLRYPILPEQKFSLNASATNQAQAAELLREALAAKGFVIVPDGKKFLLVSDKAQAAALKPRSDQLVALPSDDAEQIPPGAINFGAASVANVLMILADFRGEKLDRSSPLPALANGDCVVLINETGLTKAECRYALETLIGWQGIELVPSGNGLVKAVSTSTPDK
ncbi:MAG: hypothetical protein U1F83_09300 [Verrucomicrobiota bacterium]